MIEEIATALHAPLQNVAANWPPIEAALSLLGMNSKEVKIAALATVAVESPSFKPQTEKYNGDPQEYFKRYDGRKDLGNAQPGDGYRFRGRGFIQITGRANYAAYGAAVGRDLLVAPEDALIPGVSAQILARYFHDKGVAFAADAHDWIRVRRLVNGGTNGLADFMDAVHALSRVFDNMA